jgi:hypothetical protein
MGRGAWVGLGVVLAGAVAAVAFLLLGPDGDGNTQEPGPTRSAGTTLQAATTLSPEATTEAAVLDAYRSAWAAFIAVASDPAAPADDPRLGQHTAGNALLVRQASLVRLKSDGRAYRGEVELHPRLVELAGDSATVEDCNIDRTSVVEVGTGRVVVPPSTEGAAVTAVLRREGGVWKQVEFTDHRRACVPPPS